MIQISESGFIGDPVAVSLARDEFSKKQCAVLPGFLSATLVHRITEDLANATFEQTTHTSGEGGYEFAKDESVNRANMSLHTLRLLVNDVRLFQVIREITGCEPIGCFMGRIYRNLPSSDHHLDWHDDKANTSRMVGLSVNLSPKMYEGGVFRIRTRHSPEILAEIVHANPGDAHLFRVDLSLEHSVSTVSGAVPRTAFAGWFQAPTEQVRDLRDLLPPISSEHGQPGAPR